MIDAAEQYHANTSAPASCKIVLYGQGGTHEVLGFLNLDQIPSSSAWQLQLQSPGELASKTYNLKSVRLTAELMSGPGGTQESETSYEILVEEALL